MTPDAVWAVTEDGLFVGAAADLDAAKRLAQVAYDLPGEPSKPGRLLEWRDHDDGSTYVEDSTGMFEISLTEIVR